MESFHLHPVMQRLVAHKILDPGVGSYATVVADEEGPRGNDDLDVATGKVIGSCLPKHRHSEFLKFLKTIANDVPPGLEIHLILDNYATHKHSNVEAWLTKNPRFRLHFTPTSSSWLNLVERWFRELTDKAIRRGVFHSVPDLIEAKPH